MKRLFKKLFKGLIGVAIVTVSIAIITAGFLTYRAYHVTPLSDEEISSIGENKAEKLMIVAHPDDETLWGGLHLLEGGYFVVCITNGNNSTRKEEFYNVLKESGNDGIILSYPDKVCTRRDNWKNIRSYIESDIEKILKSKKWNMVVTHNPEGEYGHIHHKMTSSIVREKFIEYGMEKSLWYFGKYFRKAEVENIYEDMREYDSEKLKGKEELLSLYVSQERTVNKLSHMNPYENWISYEDWMSKN